jgi:hypothetical protein
MIETKVTPIYISDSELVVSFLKNKYDDLGRSFEYWHKRTQLWWQRNPYHNSNLPIGWGLWKEDTLVGYLGCIFTGLRYNGNQYISLNLTCWHVEPEFRGKSLDLFLMANTLMPQAVYFNTSPTPTVEKILKAAKYQKYIYGKDDLMCKLTPLNLHTLKIGSNIDLSVKIFRPILKLIEAGVSSYIRRVWNNKKLFITDFNITDKEELRLFVEKSKEQVLIIDRSMKFYQWLSNADHNKYHILIARDWGNEQIIAIGLFQTYEYKQNLILELVDFCSQAEGEFTDKIIIRKMIANMTEQKSIFSKYVAISITEYAGICLKSCPGKLQRRSRNNKYLKTSHTELQRLFETKQYQFSAQGDMYL